MSRAPYRLYRPEKQKPVETKEVRCPCCDNVFIVEPRQPHTDYTRGQQIMLSRMLANGMKMKVIARIFDTTVGALAGFRLYEDRIIARLTAKEEGDG